MKRFFWFVRVIGLGVIAVGMDVTLWNTWRNGLPYGTTPIMGAVSRRGITTADPVAVFSFMTVLFNALFAASFLALFPSIGMRLNAKKEALWPPAKELDVGASWICTHCQEENPGNFGECWKCQRIRRREDEA
jgi:hypothetical protein